MDELRSSRFRVTMQERHIGKKWEVSLARTLRVELAFHPIPGADWMTPFYILYYVSCVMLNIEGNHLTGISTMSRLSIQAVDEAVQDLALTTGRGYKLDKLPDGWALKPLRRRTVKLSRVFLKKRGWQFDQIEQFIPALDSRRKP